MKLNRTILGILLLALLSVSVTSCTTKSKEATEGAKSRVAQVSIEYLRLCFLANMQHISSYVLISEYLKNGKISLDEYTDQINRLPRRWPIDKHPVIQLVLLDIDVKGDIAKVSFQRGGGDSEFPRIYIDLEWTGTSWVITKDTIFGHDGLFIKG